jgi:3-oxoacyl-(acyl-carrier-protein) synthase
MRRVVVTGLGVVAPNGVGVPAFGTALRAGRSGIGHVPRLAELGFGCQVAGVPDEAAVVAALGDTGEPGAMNSNQRYASAAALEAWADAGLALPSSDDDAVDWDTGAVLGTGIGGMDTIAERVVPLTDAGNVRRLGSRAVEQAMASGTSARVAGLLGLGNQVTTNSSACSTGTEATLLGASRIRQGLAERMLCGATHTSGPDAMRVLMRGPNGRPSGLTSDECERRRPAGPEPACSSSGLERRARGARIRAELLGGASRRAPGRRA